MTPEEKIKKYCEQLEKTYNIKILFAVESGSRAWGMASANSDYDIRFVYVQKLGDYLALDKKQDCITISFEDSLYDFQGFDIYKFANLLSKSNPSCCEWLYSKIVYYGEIPSEFQVWIESNLDPLSLYYHYASMCKQNYMKYIKTRAEITYKKYLYAMRGLVNAHYVGREGFIPPSNFLETLDLMEDTLPPNIIKKLYEIIDLKKTGKEKDAQRAIPSFDDFLEAFMKENKESDEEFKVDKESLNRLVLGFVMIQ